MSQEMPHLKDLGSPRPSDLLNPGSNGPPLALEFSERTSKFMGFSHITIGIVCLFFISLKIGLIGIPDSYGLLGGPVFIAVGIFLLLLTQKKIGPSRVLAIMTMVISIIGACSAVLVIMLSVNDIQSSWTLKRHLRISESSPGAQGMNPCRIHPRPEEDIELCILSFTISANVRFALGTIMILVAFAEALLCIATSALCCNATCCKRDYFVAQRVGDQIIYYSNKSGSETVRLRDNQESGEGKVP